MFLHMYYSYIQELPSSNGEAVQPLLLQKCYNAGQRGPKTDLCQFCNHAAEQFLPAEQFLAESCTSIAIYYL